MYAYTDLDKHPKLVKRTRAAFFSLPFVNKYLRRILLHKLMIAYGIPD